MAGDAEAPVCGEYNRKNGLARQIYTIRRGRRLLHYHILGWVVSFGVAQCGGQGASGAGALQRLRELMLASTSQIVECGSSTAAFSVPSYDTSGVDRSLVRTKYRIDAIASTIPFTANSNSVA